MMKTNNMLPLQLNSVLIGIMLSDGSLYKSSLTSNTKFEMSFGHNSEQFAFFYWQNFF